MRMSRRLVPVFVAFGVILLGAWLVVPRPPAQPAADLPPGYAQGWLAGTPCAPPCWVGVTPGHTTVREALHIWGSDPGIQPGSVITKEYGSDPSGYITWNWAGGAQGGSAGYKPGVADPVVDTISPELPDAFTLQQVIDHYGQPTHI